MSSNVENGTYTAKAKQWDHGRTKGSQTSEPKDQVAVQFEITEGPHAGRCLTWYGFFTEKTMVRTLEALRYCGWTSDDVVSLEGMGNLLVSIVVENEQQVGGKNDGTWYPKVRWVNQLGGGGPIKLDQPMDMAAKRMFAAKMKMHAKQVPVVKGGYAAHAEAPKDRAPTTREPGSDDEPF